MIIIFMFVITLYSQNINAQSGWFTQSSGTNNLLWSVDFIDINTGYVVGNGGTIIKTTNGGNSWFRLNISLSNTFTGVNFIDHNTGWISAHGGLILKTTDGGNQWIIQNSGTFGNLFLVTFKNPSLGWIPSDIGVLHTTNGGTNWVQQTVPVNTFYTSIKFITPLTGWAVGGNGTIIKTTTGGLTSINPVSNEIPSHFALYQNFPNPFNPTTKINYSLPNTQYIILKVFNALGKEIAALVNEKQNAGNYSIEFDASNLSSGIYFYTLKADNFKETKRMLLLK